MVYDQNHKITLNKKFNGRFRLCDKRRYWTGFNRAAIEGRPVERPRHAPRGNGGQGARAVYTESAPRRTCFLLEHRLICPLTRFYAHRLRRVRSILWSRCSRLLLPRKQVKGSSSLCISRWSTAVHLWKVSVAFFCAIFMVFFLADFSVFFVYLIFWQDVSF